MNVVYLSPELVLPSDNIKITDKTYLVITLYKKDKLVAYASISKDNWLEYLWISPSHKKNKGLDSLLINKVLSVERGKTELSVIVEATNISEISFYQKHGFVISKKYSTDKFCILEHRHQPLP